MIIIILFRFSLFFIDEVTIGGAMRKKSISFIFASLCVWGVITYFLFLDRPIGREQNKVYKFVKESMSIIFLKENKKKERKELRKRLYLVYFIGQHRGANTGY